MNRRNIIVNSGRNSDLPICLQNKDFDQIIYELLLKATQNIELSLLLSNKIINLTEKAFNERDPDIEKEIKSLLAPAIEDTNSTEEGSDKLRESHLAIVELMARSHLIAKLSR